jgi:hypothetical protein
MEHVSKTGLLTVRDHLRVADLALGKARGVFINEGAAKSASTVNALIGRIADLTAKIDKALLTKP